MKIIEKKCPNCGATLEFNVGDKETKCKYCGSEFIIEDNNEKKKEFNVDNVTLKFVKTFTTVHFIMVGIISLIIIATFIFIFAHITRSFDNINSPFDSFFTTKKEKKDTLKITDITDEMNDEYETAARREISNWRGYLKTFEKEKDSEVVGYYYLKGAVSVKLVYVLKSTYKNSTDEKTVYTALSFVGMSLDSISDTPFIDSKAYYLNDNEYVYGYESIEKLYKNQIKKQKKLGYKVVATKDLYIED